MIKKIISLAAFLLLILSAFANAEVYVCEDFSDSDTGIVALVEKTQNGQINYARVNDGRNNGYAMLKSTFEGDCIINVPFDEAISGNIVLEADFFVEGCPGNLQLFYIRQVRSSVKYDTALWNVTGDVLSAGGKHITLEKSKWYHAAVVIDIAKGTAVHYLDGILIAEGALSNKAYTGINNVWFRYAGAAGAEAGIDNIKIYRGSKVQKLSDEAVIINESFDNPGAVYSKGEKSDSSGIKNTVEEKDGTLKVVKRTTAQDCFVDFGLNQTSGKVVIEADVMTSSKNLGSYVFYLRDSKSSHTGSTSQHIVTLSGGTFYASGKAVATGENKWHRMILSLDLDNHKYTLTCGENRAEGTTDQKINTLNLLRFYVTSGTGTGELLIDNLKVYTGEARDIASDETAYNKIQEMFVSDEYLMDYLGNAKAFVADGGFIADGVKTYPEDTLYIKDDEYYIGVNDFIKLTGKNVTISGDSVICDGKEYAVGKRVVKVNGTKSFSKHYPERSKNGVIMIPFRLFSDGVVYTEFDNNLVVVGKDITGGVYIARYLGSLLKRDCMDSDELLHFTRLEGRKHPSIIADEESFTRVKNTDDKTLATWRDALIKKADNVLGASALEYKIADGLRLLSVAQDFNNRITLLGFAWKMTGDDKYYNEAYELMHSVGEFPDWNSKLHFLDTAEMAYGVAVYYDWFYQKHTKEERKYVTNALNKNAFVPAVEVYKGIYDGSAFWRQTTTNWGMICNGSIGMAALAVMEENPEYYSDVLRCAMRSLDFMWYELMPDGGWHEGVGYWEYTYCYMSRFFSSLVNTIGRDTGYLKGDETEGYGYFRRNLTTKNGADNFDDAFCYQYDDYGAMWLARVKNNSEFAVMRKQNIEKGYANVNMFDVLWYDEASEVEASESVGDIVYKSIDSAIFRDSFDEDNSLYFALHGGKNSEAHSHYDGGTFTYEIDGVRWTKDPGYALGASGANPYGKAGLYRARAEGHSTVVINPSFDAGQDTDGDGKITRFESSGGEGVAVLDMSSYYKNQVNSFERAAYVDSDRKTVTIKDEIALKQASDIFWFMQTNATVTKVLDNVYKLSEGSKSVYLSFLSNADNVRLEVGAAQLLSTSPNVSGQPGEGSLKRIAIIANGSGDISITVRLTPDYDKTVIDDIAISDMKVNPLCDNFAAGENKGLYGKDSGDKSARAVTVKKNIPISDNMTLSFYAAFEDANKDNTALMYIKSGFEPEEKQTELISFLADGKLRILGTDANIGGKAWALRKWHKVDMLLDFTNGVRATVYIDNKLIASGIESEIAVPDEICGFFFGMHIDDLKLANTSSAPKTVTLVNTVWDYNKFLTCDKGIYAFESVDKPYDSTSLKTLVKNGVKSVEAVRKNFPDESYYIITATDGAKLYAPIYGVGELIASYNTVGNEEILTESAYCFGVTTARFKLKKNAPGKAYIYVNGAWNEFMSVDENGTITAGGKVCKKNAKELPEVSVTVVPGKKIIEIYVDDEYVKHTAFSKNADSFGGVKFSFKEEAAEKLIIHSGGADNTFRIGNVAEDSNGAAVEFKAIDNTNAYLAGYTGDRLTDISAADATGNKEELVIEGSFDKIKAFVWDNMQKPKR